MLNSFIRGLFIGGYLVCGFFLGKGFYWALAIAFVLTIFEGFLDEAVKR